MTHPARTAAAVLFVASIVALLTAWIGTHPMPLPPCPTEDSVSCRWDAQTMGNGVGRSFTVDAQGTVTYTR